MRKGFTLVQLIVVMAVLAVLVMLAVPQLMGHTEQAQLTRLLCDGRLLEDACHRYYIDNQDWPRESDTPLTAAELTEIAYAINGDEETLNPAEHNYYRLDMQALSKYVRINSDPLNFVLQNPEGCVYALPPGDNPVLAGGSDEPQAPEGWTGIDTAEELAKIGNDPAYPLDGQYILMADIDLSGYSAGEGWVPIGTYTGNESSQFSGKFNGNNLTISNLTIDRPSISYQGLFGKTTNAEITNVVLNNANITGVGPTGGLVGFVNGGTITSCYLTGNVTGSSWGTAGLVGQNYSGTIARCYALCNVSGYYYTGGLVGYNCYGTITSSYAAGSVTAGNDFAGGLVGENYHGNVINCYATSSVQGVRYTGGLVGYGDHDIITNSYAVGSVTGGTSIGGLIGKIDTSSISSSYWDYQTSGTTTSAGGTYKSTSNMKKQATFIGWDFADIWAIEENITYPYLQDVEQIPHPQ